MHRSRPTLGRPALPGAVFGIVAALLLAAAPALASGRSSASAAIAALDRAIAFSGVAYGVDTVANQVLVTVDGTVAGARLSKVEAAVRQLGSAARLVRVAGTFRLDGLIGGQAIYGSRYRCSLGFNARTGTASTGYTYWFLTAGHCGKAEKTWWTASNHSTLLGSTTGAAFPGDDFAIVKYDASYYAQVDTLGAVRNGNTTRDITGVGDAYVNEPVTRDGSTTGTHGGNVTAVNVTVRYLGGGVVRGLIQTTVCAEPGDSGGPLYDGSLAIGLTSGGSGDCKKGGTTFFQPVREATNVYGVSIY